MKKFIISLLIVAAFVAIPVSVFAQTEFSANGNSQARARIVTAISVTNERDLDFGSILGDVLSSGTVVIPATSAATASSTDFTLGVGTSQSAQFDVVGSPNASYTVTLPSEALTLSATLSGNGTVVTVNPFTSSVLTDGVLDDGGLQTFYVGGTLNVPLSAVADSYTGSFNVTVAYN